MVPSLVTGRRPSLALAATATAAALLACLAGSAYAAAGTGRAGSPAGTITTIAGGVGGPARASQVAIAPCGTGNLTGHCGLTFASGSLYFTDLGDSAENHPENGGLVRQVSLATGLLTTPAGDGQRGSAGDGDPATQAQLTPAGVAIDGNGNLVIAGGTGVRVVAHGSGTFYGQAMTAGDIYLIAGGGTSLHSGVPATTASILPVGISIDHAGNVVIDESRDLRVIAASTGTFYGRAMTAGDIYTLAGGGTSTRNGVPAIGAELIAQGLAIDPAGNLLLSDDARAGRVRVVAAKSGRFYGQAMAAGDIYTVAGGGGSVGNGVPARSEQLGDPAGVAIDHAGNVVFADFTADLVRVAAVRTGQFYGRAMTAGDIYTIAGGGSSLLAGALTTSAKLSHPNAVTVDSAGNVIISADLAHRIEAVAVRSGNDYGVRMSAGHIYPIAGNGAGWSTSDGVPGTSAQIVPGPMAVDASTGNFAVDDSEPVRRKDRAGATIRLQPAQSGTFFGRAMLGGNLYAIAGAGVEGYSGDGGPATSAEFNDPGSMAFDAEGNLVIADTFNYRVRVVASGAGTFYGRVMRAGHIYTVAGDGSFIVSGDGGPAIKAGLQPDLVAVDPDGNLIIGGNTRIRVVAAHAGTYYGLAMRAGDVYTIAGGSAGTAGDGGPEIGARFELISGLALDGPDGVIISDLFRVRMIATTAGIFYGIPMVAGDVYTIAGDGKFGITGDGGPAVDAAITNEAATVDSAGNLVFDDSQAARIRVVPTVTSTFYGIAMTAGDLYTIAGGGTGGLGDGGPGAQATIGHYVPGLAAGMVGGVVFSDYFNARVRMIAD